MKRILAILVAGVLMVSSSVCVFASDTSTDDGSKSVTTDEKIEELQDEIDDLKKEIKKLTKAVKASQSGGSSGGSSSSDAGSQALSRNNAVSYGSNIVAQGGHVEINGGRSNVTFVVNAVSGGTLSSAGSLAGSVGGTLLNVVSTSSPGASFKTAKVNFYISGVSVGDNIAVYQLQGNKWVQLPTAEIRNDHVVVNMTRHGAVAFIRVPVLAAATN